MPLHFLAILSSEDLDKLCGKLRVIRTLTLLVLLMHANASHVLFQTFGFLGSFGHSIFV